MTSNIYHYLMKQSLIIILRGWRRGHSVKGVSQSKGKDSRTWQKKREGEKKIKSRPFAFHASEAPKRIRNNWALGILSSLAIRLSWWRERREWQGSRPSLGLTQREGVFSPTPPLSSSPFRVSEMQLKYLSKKTAQSPMPNLNHGGWWDWGGGERGIWEKTHILFTIHLYTLYEARIQGRRSRFVYDNQIQQIRHHIFMRQKYTAHPWYHSEHQLTNKPLGCKMYYRNQRRF